MDGIEIALSYVDPAKLEDESTREHAAAQTTSAKEMLRTLRATTDPGPQLDSSKQPVRSSFPRKDGPPLTFVMPKSWAVGEGSNRMRLADIRIGGTPPVIGAAYWFGPNQGGSVEANMARWAGQFGKEPSEPPKAVDVAKGIRATTLDLSNDEQRMLATVLEVPTGKVFFKFVGPRATMDKAADDYYAWVKSFRTE